MSRKMKDSDVQWLGEIPSDWKITNLKKVSKIKTGSTPSGKSEEKFSDISGLEWIKTNNLLGTDGISESKLKITSEYEKKATLAPLYSTLVCCIGDIGKLGFNIELVSYNQQINAVNFNNDLVNWKYGFYSLYAQKDQHIAHSNGNVLRILNTENQKKITISIPSMKEQIIIVKVLDKKTTEIDNVVEKTKESIEELKAYKQSLITETVTKGLNPDIPMKASGIEWIGEIPTNWEINLIGSLYSQRNQKVSDREYEPLSVTKNGIVPQLETAAKSDNHNNRKLVKYNDFVINSRSDRKMSAGLSNYEGSVSVINTVLKSKYIHPEYSKYLLKNVSFAEEFYKWGTGIVDDLWSTRWDKMKNIPVPVPTRSEQVEIARYLNKRTKQIDNIIIKKQQMLKELESYKQSLIYEYVTGKKEVE